jgi:hypothetical protein
VNKASESDARRQDVFFNAQVNRVNDDDDAACGFYFLAKNKKGAV